MNVPHAIIHMQPLNARRQPMGYPIKRNAQTVPRDGEPHRVGDVWELDRTLEHPYFCRVWADDKHIDLEIDCAGPASMRHLSSVTFYTDLRVLPRKQ